MSELLDLVACLEEEGPEEEEWRGVRGVTASWMTHDDDDGFDGDGFDDDDGDGFDDDDDDDAESDAEDAEFGDDEGAAHLRFLRTLAQRHGCTAGSSDAHAAADDAREAPTIAPHAARRRPYIAAHDVGDAEGADAGRALASRGTAGGMRPAGGRAAARGASEAGDETDVLVMLLRGMEADGAARAARAVARACTRGGDGRNDKPEPRSKTHPQRGRLLGGSGAGGGAAARQPLAANRPQRADEAARVRHW